MRTHLAPLLTLATQARSREIAEAVTSDVRTVVTAPKTSRGGRPDCLRARDELRAARRALRACGRARAAGHLLPETVTGPRAVCRLEIRTEGPGATFRPRAVVQLLASPSLGCGRASTYALVE